MAQIGYKFSASLTFLLTFVIFVISNRETFVREGLFDALWSTCLPFGTVFLILPMLIYSLYQIINSLIKNYKKFRKVFYVELSLICILSLFTSITACTIMGTPISDAKKRKVTDTVLYPCEIVNEPLKEYIKEKFIPVITDSITSGKFENYLYIAIDKSEDNECYITLSCRPIPETAALYVRQMLVTNYKYRYYTKIDDITFEIYSKTLNSFIKPVSGRNLIVNNNPDNTWIIPRRKYEVILEFKGQEPVKYEILNPLGFAEL